MEAQFTINNKTFTAKIDNTLTGKAVLACAPFKISVHTWGDEIYFDVPGIANVDTEPDAKTVLEVGDIAYYPPMKVLCIFFGPTPISQNNEPRAAGEVNVCGRLTDVELELLRGIRDGEMVEVKLA